MFKVVFYEDKNGKSEIYEQMMDLANKSNTNKDCRIQLKQITLYVDLLKQIGMRIPKKITKHIRDEIWELRPGNNRIMFFCHIENTFVLLHMFRKQTQKTPNRKIEKAFDEMNDYIARHGGFKKWELGKILKERLKPLVH